MAMVVAMLLVKADKNSKGLKITGVDSNPVAIKMVLMVKSLELIGADFKLRKICPDAAK